MMNPQSEQFVTLSSDFHDLIISNSAKSHQSQMEDITLSPDSSFHGDDSPTQPRVSCRPSTVFYSPRFEEMRNSKSDNLSNQNQQKRKLMRSYESKQKNNAFLGGVQTSNTAPYASSIAFDIENHNELFTIPSTVPSTIPSTVHYGGDSLKESSTAKTEVFGDAIPVIGDTRHLKPYKDLYGAVESHCEGDESDAIRKAAYTQMLRKLTKKEEAIDDWESKRRAKLALELEKLEKKLEHKRAEAVQKVHKKLTDTKLEAQKKKAKARRSALKEMSKHCSPLE